MQMLPGTLELPVLKALIWEPRHGYGIMDWIQDSSERGWLEAEWGRSETNRRAKSYRLTPRSRMQLTAKTSEWDRHVDAISRVLGATRPQEGTP